MGELRMKTVFADYQKNKSFEKETLIFKSDNWNDYGYNDLFSTKYIDSNYNMHDIGSYRIIIDSARNEYVSLNYIKENRGRLDENCLSVGTGLDFYKNLYSSLINDISLEQIKSILKKLHDVLFIDERIDIKRGKTLDNKEIKSIYIKDLGKTFNEVNNTLFRDDDWSLYDLNNVLESINKSVIDLFDPKQFSEIKAKIDSSNEFTQKLCESLKKFNNYSFKPLISVFINGTSKGISKNYKKILKLIWNIYPFDVAINEKISQVLKSTLSPISENIKKIKKDLSVNLEEIKSMEIGQYTKIGNLKYLLKDERKEEQPPFLRLTNINQLNDPLEDKVLSNYLNIDPTNVSHSYVSSATVSVDSLPMWNLYAEDATGVFLVYDKEFLEKIESDESIDLFHVCYIDHSRERDKNNCNEFSIPSIKDSNKEQKIINDIKSNLEKIKSDIDALEEKEDKQEALQLVENISFLFKDAGYSYERELRLYIESPDEVKSIDREGFPFPFLYTYYQKNKLRYSKIVLGPKGSIDIDYIAPYVSYLNIWNKYNVKVERSKRKIR